MVLYTHNWISHYFLKTNNIYYVPHALSRKLLNEHNLSEIPTRVLDLSQQCEGLFEAKG